MTSGSPHTPPVRPDWDALARFAAGECDPGERARVGAWLNEHPAERALVDALAAPLADARARDIDVDAALARVHRHMQDTESARDTGHAPRDLRFGRPAAPATRRWRSAAAASLLAAAAIVLLVFGRGRRSAHTGSGTQLAARTYTTSVGQQDSIRLADGSLVVLGPDSRLDVSPFAAQRARVVALEGDAVFDVRHDAAAPFRVRVDHALIEDIGTTFAVESDARNATRVSVLAGRVRLRGTTSSAAADTGVTLAAGDRGTVDLTGAAHAERQVTVADDVAWTSGRLAFRDAPLAQIAGELHRWYGVLLIVPDSSLIGRHVTTNFDSDQPVDDALTKIALALGARVDRHGDTATLTLKRGSAPIR